MSIRKQQIESVLKRAISQLLVRKISDPRIVGMVSITRVDMSPDMSQATIHVSVLPQEHEKTTAAGLNHAAAYIHGLLRKHVTFKTVPHLTFRLDHDIKKESSVMEAINRGVAREGGTLEDVASEADSDDSNTFTDHEPSSAGAVEASQGGADTHPTQNQGSDPSDTARGAARDVSGEAAGGQESNQ